MYALSLWARDHKWVSRFIIISIYVLLHLIGFCLGEALTVHHITLSASLFYAVAFLFFVGVAFYPSRERKPNYRHFYAARKTADTLLAVTTFLMIIWVANNISAWPFTANNTYAATIQPVKPVHKTPLLQRFFSMKNPIWKVLPRFDTDTKVFKKLKANVQTLRKAYRDTSKGGKIALTILLVLVAIGLVGLLAGLSCNLSCSGSDGLAILVGVVGTALVIFLFIRVIHRIYNGPRKPKPQPAPSPVSS